MRIPSFCGDHFKKVIALPVLLLIISSTATSQVTTGLFGGDAAASGHPNPGNTYGKWVKLGELTLNGNYNAAGITVDFFPKNANHGDARQELNVQFRNNNGTGIYQSTYDISLIHYHGGHKTIKDVKVVHTSGSGVSLNKLSVWVQMGISWLSGVPIEVRAYGNVTFHTTNQPYHTSITETGTVYDLKTYQALLSDQFEVEGTIRSKEVKVEAANWPDYVFAEDYELRSLEETESFIRTHHRLPEMPPAKQVEEEGIELGEMNRLLLEKVEELTLHVIELKKENEQLKKLFGVKYDKVNGED